MSFHSSAHRAFLMLVLAAVVGLSGCARRVELREVAQRLDTVRVQVLQPDRAANELMQCLGTQFEIFRPASERVLVAVYPYSNRSLSTAYTPQDLPMDVTSVLMASLNSISPRITFTDILEPVDGIQAQTLSALMPNDLARPNLYLRGSILFPERATEAESSSADLGISLPFGSIRFSRKVAASIAGMELDLNATLPERQSAYGLSAPIRVLFDRSEGSQNTASISIEQVAVGGETVTRVTQSFGPALRLAVGHQLIKVLGRYAGLPWWRCVSDQDVPPDPVVERHYRERFETLISQHGLAAGVGWLQTLLAYNGQEVAKTNILDDPTRQSLAEFMAKHGKSFIESDLPSALFELVSAVPEQSAETIARAQLWEQRWSQPEPLG